MKSADQPISITHGESRHIACCHTHQPKPKQTIDHKISLIDQFLQRNHQSLQQEEILLHQRECLREGFNQQILHLLSQLLFNFKPNIKRVITVFSSYKISANFIFIGYVIHFQEEKKQYRTIRILKKQQIINQNQPLMSDTKGELVQCFGRKKNAVASASVRTGKGVLRVNGCPVDMLEPQALRVKVMEPVLLLGLKRFQNLDVRVKVRGSGYVSQIYAIRQAISKGVVAYYQKFVNETQKRQIKEALLQYDRSLLVADPRRCEPKKFGGPGARARIQKSYR